MRPMLAVLLCAMQASALQLSSWTIAPESSIPICECPGVRSFRGLACLCLNGTYDVRLPATLLGSLLDHVPFDPMFGENLNDISPTPFYKQTWSLRSQFFSPQSTNVFLDLEGVNYRADVFVNGGLAASRDNIIGPFRRFVVDLSTFIVANTTNNLELKLTPSVDHTFPPNSNSTDLSITFVDWNPEPPDRSMGLLQPAIVRFLQLPVDFSGLSSEVTLSADHASFNVTLSFVLTMLAQSIPGDVTLTLHLSSGANLDLVGEVTSSCQPECRVYFRPEDYPQLAHLDASHLWHPWQNGDQVIHQVTISFATADTRQVLANRTSIAFRNVQSYIDAKGSRQFTVNGRPVQIRGGGWAPDLFLRSNDTRLALEFEMVRQMNLNAVRLEGKFMWDAFFEMADRFGFMILPGWCCCDSWQHWQYWQSEQYTVARESLRTQLRRLARFGSVITFFYSSDQLPPARVEKMYLSVFEEEAWPNPTVSSASATPSNISGPSGVKMSGPYAWVPPVYWLQDSNQTFQNLGGAWGFLTEGGPGGSPMTFESWKRTVPTGDLWSNDGLLSPAFSFHCANPMGMFRDLGYFAPALSARYGSSSGARGALYRSQAATFEAIRAMFEGYTRNKNHGATGLIQWMMNNAWPSNMWHLFDYYLNAGGGFYGAKSACRPITAILSYVDYSVTLDNSLQTMDAAVVRASVHSFDGTLLWHAETPWTLTQGYSSLLLSSLGIPVESIFGSTSHDAILIRLSCNVLSSRQNHSKEYWIARQMDILNWTASTWWITPVQTYANFSSLNDVGNVTVTVNGSWSPSIRGGSQFSGVVHNLEPNRVAFLVSFVVLLESVEINPVMFEDSYYSLLPGESRSVEAWAPTIASSAASKVRVEPRTYNNEQAL